MDEQKLPAAASPAIADAMIPTMPVHEAEASVVERESKQVLSSNFEEESMMAGFEER